jgi:hypothetical protein
MAAVFFLLLAVVRVVVVDGALLQARLHTTPPHRFLSILPLEKTIDLCFMRTLRSHA